MTGAILEGTAKSLRQVPTERGFPKGGIAAGNALGVFREPDHRTVAEHFSTAPFRSFDHFVEDEAGPHIPQAPLPW